MNRRPQDNPDSADPPAGSDSDSGAQAAPGNDSSDTNSDATSVQEHDDDALPKIVDSDQPEELSSTKIEPIDPDHLRFTPASRDTVERVAIDVEEQTEVAASVPTTDVDLTAGVESEVFERIRPHNTRRSGRILKLILSMGLLVALAGGIFGGVTYWRWQDRTSQSVADRFDGHPTIVEKLGGIESCSFSLFETMGSDIPEDHIVAFRVHGPDGSGFIYTKTNASHPSEQGWAALRIEGELWTLDNEN